MATTTITTAETSTGLASVGYTVDASPPVAAEPVTTEPLGSVPSPPMRRRVRDWIRALYRDPDAEARAIEDRRARLLGEINQAVADAPDDIPIKQLIEQLNRHHDD